MRLPKDALKIGRIIQEDDDFVTLEVGKHDDVKWHVAPLPGEEDKPQRFLTLIFVHKGEDGMEVWVPWEGEDR